MQTTAVQAIDSVVLGHFLSAILLQEYVVNALATALVKLGANVIASEVLVKPPILLEP